MSISIHTCCIVAIMVAEGIICAGAGAILAYLAMRERAEQIHHIYRAIRERQR